MTATYRETEAPEAARQWLAASWRLTAADEHRQRIVPDGCIDLVWRHAEGLLLVGANTTAFMAAIDAGPGAVGVRFLPGGAPPLLGVRAEGIRDARLPARSVLGGEGARLEERLYAAPDSVAREHTLVEWVLMRARHAHAPQPLVAAAVARLTTDPQLRLTALGRELAVSERHLRRQVASEIGYGPKLLARVLRLRRALAQAREGHSLAHVAAASGYADQSHFSNDCRELAGASPAALLWS